MFGANPFLNAMPPQQEVEEEKEDDGGIAFPLGFTHNVTDFSSNSGQKKIEVIRKKQEKSILFTPLMTSITKCISLIFFASPFMAINNLFALLSAAMISFSNVFTMEIHMSFEKRIMALAIGLGLVLFVMWRASAIGLLGFSREEEKEDVYIPLLVNYN